MTRLTQLLSVAAAGVAACATSQGTSPGDMSAEEHLAASARDEEAAASHRARYDPAGWEKRDCRGIVRGELLQPCWRSLANPTARHLEEEGRHRELAARHRAASDVLRDAEVSACGGVADADRDMSPFAHREDVEKVEAIVDLRAPGDANEARVLGATIFLRPVPGLTAERLQRIVDCHLARYRAGGQVSPGAAFCPLALLEVRALVRSLETGLAVAISSTDPGTGREIMRRARSLLEPAREGG